MGSGSERPDEVAARKFVEAATGCVLVYVDSGGVGRVDYEFELGGGRRAALEVTSVTNPSAKVAQDAFDKQAGPTITAPALSSCWMVMLDGIDAKYKGIGDRLGSALKVLEVAGAELQLGSYPLDFGSGEIRAAVGRLRSETVMSAHPIDVGCSDLDHQHSIHLLRSSGGTASGSNSTIDLVVQDLGSKPDNYRKLREAHADEAHLFVWLDGHTDVAIVRPFMGGQAAKYDHFLLPTVHPGLPSDVDQLWIVYRPTNAGWRWVRGSGWFYVGEWIAGPTDEVDEE